MLGTSMDVPMLLSRLIDHAADFHGDTEIVGRRICGTVERETWAGLRSRSKRLANALAKTGLGVDDCVGSLAWNTINHLELFYGALGMGIGLHTLNPRLALHDLAYMIEKVGESTIFIDAATLDLAEELAPMVPAVTRWIYMDEGDERPNSSLAGLICKSDFIGDAHDQLEWPCFDERQAAIICFTSGTTGRPKGVAYSHRAVTLGAMNQSMADTFGSSIPGAIECEMPLAAVFHANGWLMPFTAPMNGRKLVLCGRRFDGPSAVDLILDEQVTIMGAVPTVWADVVAEMQARKLAGSPLRIGLLSGTRPSAGLLEAMQNLSIRPCLTWGMTEVPAACRMTPPPGWTGRTGQATEAWPAQGRQGRASFQVQLRIVDEDGRVLPNDGLAAGELQTRGPGVTGRYVGDAPEDAHSWLPSGDIVRLFPDGSIEVVDRAKDMIKSGGEWISAQQIELAAQSHPAVHQAAVIAIPHPRWQERPMLLCTLHDGCRIDERDLLKHIAPHVARWWLPDEVVFVASLPTTASGKINKTVVRQLYTGRSAKLVP